MLRLLAILFINLISHLVYASDTINIVNTNSQYDSCYNFLERQLSDDGSFKLCVLKVEQTFENTSFGEELFKSSIVFLKQFATNNAKEIKIANYKFNDSTNYKINFSIFSVLHDSLIIHERSGIYQNAPYRYNFTDPEGKKDWSNMLVTKLLATHEGNCHSLAYLYKILADELNVKCWLSLAPNHIYIRNYSDKNGWYNTELTSGTFPTDAWLMVTGYISPKALRAGLYLDTLSNQQAIALCVLDLAKEYEFQTHDYYDGFILKCCNLVLRYHSVNPMALLLKAETLKKVYLNEKKRNNADTTALYQDMTNAYITLAKLGYREMPEKTYEQWLKGSTEERTKYTNSKIKRNAPSNGKNTIKSLPE